MKHVSESGSIYDSIFYCIEYFNKRQIDSYIQNCCPDPIIVLNYFVELRDKIPSLPSIVEPFFYMGKIPSAISSFFDAHFIRDNQTVEDFFENLRYDTQQLYQEVIKSVFQTDEHLINATLLPSIAPMDYVDALDRLDMSLEFKLQFALLMGNFNFGVTRLIDTLKMVYGRIVIFRQKHEKEIKLEFENVCYNQKASFYHQYFKFDESVKLVSASISLLNPLVLSCGKDSDQGYMIAGIMHNKELSSHTYEDKINADSFVITCGNELRMSVIHALINCGELTTSELSRMLDCPVPTLLKHIDVLRSHSVIYISRRSGLKIFYRLNVTYFENVKIQLNQLFEQIINKEKEYEREKDYS